MDLLDDFSSQLMDSIGMNAQSVFGELPPLPGAVQAPQTQPAQPVPELAPIQQNDAPVAQPPGAPVTSESSSKDGVQWMPGVGFVQKNTGNAAQEWQAAAGSPAPNLAAIQKHNAELTNPNNASQQGGPGRAPSTVRYYTRKLARTIFMNKGSSPEARMQAHQALRFNGADSSKGGAQGLSDPSWWNSFFARNENNNFGEGMGEHLNDQLVNEPGGGMRFKYLTDIL